MQFLAPSDSLTTLIKLCAQTSTHNRVLTAHGKEVSEDDDRHEIPVGEHVDEEFLVELVLSWGLNKGAAVTVKLQETNPTREEGDLSHGWRFLKQAKISAGNISGTFAGPEANDLLSRIVQNFMADPSGNAGKLELLAPIFGNTLEHLARGSGAFLREARKAIADTPIASNVVYLPAPVPSTVQAPADKTA